MRLLEVDAVRDAIRPQMHFRVQLREGDTAYALSDSAISRMSDYDLIRKIAPEMARMLVIKLRQQRRRA
jgi:hypothetical protein